ncbi:MAG: hypothetical protein AAF549_00235 [Pseudomonadota bacterium]
MDQIQQSFFESQRTAGVNAKKALSIQSWKQGSKVTASQKLENNFKDILVNDTPELPKTSLALSAQGSSSKNSRPYEFKDVIDIINPLHHIPLISGAYRKLTGDALHPASRIIGGSLYGGPIGAVTSTLHTVSEMKTGKDLNSHALSLASGRLPGIEEGFEATRAYQDTDNFRTANWSPSPQIQSGNRYEENIYSYDPVTEISLSPMPEKRIIKEV